MKAFKLVVLFSLVSISLLAQESAKYRITYDCDAEEFVGKKATYRWTLDIGDESAVFYNSNYRNYNIELDSLAESADASVLLEEIAKLGKKYAGRNSLQVLTNKPEKGMYTYLDGAGGSSLRYEENLPQIDWQLVDSTKTICGYACNMAVGNVYGRNWTVWYSTEIPLLYGPYVLNGLPGLIMAASDNDGAFNFVVMGICEAPEGTSIKLDGVEKTMKCSRKRFLELRKESSDLTFNQRAERTRQQLGLDDKGTKVVVVNSDGKEVAGDELIPKRNYLDLE